MEVAWIDPQAPIQRLREARREAREPQQVIDEIVAAGRVEDEKAPGAYRGEQVTEDLGGVRKVLEDLSHVDALDAGG